MVNEQMMKDVLEDVLEELIDANRSLTEMRTRLSALEAKVGGFDQKLADQQLIVHPPDLAPVLKAIREQCNGLQAKTEAQIAALRKETEVQMTAFRGETAEAIRRLSEAVEAQPKPIIRQWRLCFFPEKDYSGSYKHFINWLFGGTMLALLVGALYMLGRQYMEKMPPPATMTMDTSTKIIPHPHPGSKRIRPEVPKVR